MTEQEAKTILETESRHHPETSIFGEALQQAIKALEKQMPKKPKGIDKDICPNCSTYNSVIQSRRKARSNDVVYCWHCGTAIECEV